MGILDLVTLAAALAFAAPTALYGVETAASGDPAGWVFLAIAVGIVAVERYLVTPTDLPVLAAQTATEAVVEDADDAGKNE